MEEEAVRGVIAGAAGDAVGQLRDEEDEKEEHEQQDDDEDEDDDDDKGEEEEEQEEEEKEEGGKEISFPSSSKPIPCCSRNSFASLAQLSKCSALISLF